MHLDRAGDEIRGRALRNRLPVLVGNDLDTAVQRQIEPRVQEDLTVARHAGIRADDPADARRARIDGDIVAIENDDAALGVDQAAIGDGAGSGDLCAVRAFGAPDQRDIEIGKLEQRIGADGAKGL